MDTDQRRAIEYVKNKYSLDILIFCLFHHELYDNTKRIPNLKTKIKDYLRHQYYLKPEYFRNDYEPSLIEGFKAFSKGYVEVYKEMIKECYEDNKQEFNNIGCE